MKNKSFTTIIIVLVATFNLTASAIIIAKDCETICTQKNARLIQKNQF